MTQGNIMVRMGAVLAALALAFAIVLTAGPARAAVPYYEIGDASGTYMNFWAGGFAVLTWQQSGVANNDMQVQSLGGGNVQVFDWIHGGCVGDLRGDPGLARAGGGQSCPSSGAAGWGTRMRLISCGGGYFQLWDVHWDGWVSFPDGSGHAVYLNHATGKCLLEQG